MDWIIRTIFSDIFLCKTWDSQQIRCFFQLISHHNDSRKRILHFSIGLHTLRDWSIVNTIIIVNWLRVWIMIRMMYCIDFLLFILCWKMWFRWKNPVVNNTLAKFFLTVNLIRAHLTFVASRSNHAKSYVLKFKLIERIFPLVIVLILKHFRSLFEALEF